MLTDAFDPQRRQTERLSKRKDDSLSLSSRPTDSMNDTHPTTNERHTSVQERSSHHRSVQSAVTVIMTTHNCTFVPQYKVPEDSHTGNKTTVIRQHTNTPLIVQRVLHTVKTFSIVANIMRNSVCKYFV